MDRISRALEQARSKVARVHEEVSDQDIPVREEREYTSSHPVTLSSELLHENRIITGIDDGTIVDAYGLLRTRILKLMRQNNWKTIGVTSPNSSAGKTVTAINLSISIAQDQNHSVLLVDSDLRKPGIKKTLGINPKRGLNDYLSGDKEKGMDNIFLYPRIKHLVIVPTNPVLGGTSELLSSPRMKRFVEQARARYPERIVVFDMPPILVGDDVVALSQNLDAILIVVEDGKTQSDELVRATDLIQDVNVIGVVLNKAATEKNQSDYYY